MSVLCQLWSLHEKLEELKRLRGEEVGEAGKVRRQLSKEDTLEEEDEEEDDIDDEGEEEEEEGKSTL